MEYKSEGADGGVVKLRVELVDFAGQVEYYIGHQIFMSDIQCLYVVMAEYGKAEEGMSGWLSFLKSMVSSGSRIPVMLVCSKAPLGASTPDAGGGDGQWLKQWSPPFELGDDGKVFFRSEDMSDWTDYSTNFPAGASLDFASAQPFFRDGKLRACGNMGIWETPLYNANFGVAAINPMVDKNKGYACARDTFYFDDYSMVNHANTTWSWSFSPAPAYISDIHARNPKVIFGSSGKYSVTETITRNGKNYSKTIKDMVDLSTDICGTTDTIPGNGAVYAGAQYSVVPAMNITTNTFTMSLWLKPEAAQDDWAGLVLTSGAPKIGLNVLSTLELRYNWNDNYWWDETGLFLTPGKWNHVVMVIEPAKATIYLNGAAKVINETHDPMNLISPFQIGRDGNYDNRYLRGQVDELCFWNRALTQNEIREQMHLVKNTATDNQLIHYYQFNENNSPVAYDKKGIKHIQMGSASSSTSSAPVGAGVSKCMNVTAAGSYSFGSTGLKINFAAGTVPNGEVCVTRINQNSQNSSTANKGLLFGRYWAVNNYGANKTFTNVSSMEFDDCGVVTANEISNPSKIKLFKRGSFDDASANWQQAGTALQVTGTGSSSNINFTSPSVTNAGQFELQRTDAVLAVQSVTISAEILNTKSILVQWEVNGEHDVNNYAVERSTDGIHFTALNTVQAANTHEAQKYQYTDAAPVNGILYYRIKVVNRDGSLSYSSGTSISFRQLFSLFEVSPNPLQREQLLTVNTVITEPYTLYIYNASGKEIYNGKHNGNTQVRLNSPAAGAYFYRIVWSSGMVNGKLIVK